MNWRKSPINARHHPLLAGVLRRFGKPGYCAYQWMLDLYAIHFGAVGGEVPLVMDHKTLKRELDLRRWATFWAFLRFVADWPAVASAAGDGDLTPGYGPSTTRIRPEYDPSTTQIQPNFGLDDSNTGREYSSLLPKWIFWTEGRNVFIYIPNFLKSADEWTRKKHRQNGGQESKSSGASSGEMPAALRRVLRPDKRRVDREENARGGPSRIFEQTRYREPPTILAAMLAAPCREIERLSAADAPGGFCPWWFTKNHLHRGHHAKAIERALLQVKANKGLGVNLDAVAADALAKADAHYGDQWANAEITRALMPEFNRVLVPKVVANEVKA